MMCILSSNNQTNQMTTIAELNQEIQRLKELHRQTLQKNCETITQLAVKHRDEMTKMLEDNIALKEELALMKNQRPRYTVPQDASLVGDATFDYYWTRDDADMTIWKVPRHLAEVKSAQTSSHGAVEQAFYDEKFGEEYGKLEYLIVREMKEADLVKRKIQLKKEEEKYTDCDECGRFCYTGGNKHPDGYVCAYCDDDEENSEDDE